jgi:hypothetical protein
MNELEYLANQSKVDVQHVPITKTFKKKNQKKNQINISSNSNSIPKNLHQGQCLNNKP